MLCLSCLTPGIAAAGTAPAELAERWIVVLASFKDPTAARNRAQAQTPPPLVVSSDEFAGLAPGYQLVALGPFADRSQAQAARESSAIAGAYLKFTGARRSTPPKQKHSAWVPPTVSASASPPPLPPDEPPAPSPAPWAHDFLDAPRVQALREWEQVQRQQPGITGFEIVDVIDPNSGTYGALLINNRRKFGARCEVGYREIEFERTERGVRAKDVRVLGYRCCDRKACPLETPASYMLELLDGRDVRWAVDRKRGVRLEGERHSRRVTGASALEEVRWWATYNPLYDSFDCPEAFTDGKATCMKYAGGEGYDFVWRKTPKGAVLESMSVRYTEDDGVH